MEDRSRIFDQLRRLEPLKSISDGDLRLLPRYSSHAKLRRGKVVYYQSDRAESVYLLLSGTVRKVKYRADESSLVMGKAMSGEWLGIAEVLLDSLYLNDAVAEEESELLCFPKANFHQLSMIGGTKDLFIRELARGYYLLHNQIELNLPVSRLIAYLLSDCRESGTEGGKRLVSATQDEISQAIGVTRETVNKYLGLLQNDGLIVVGRGRIEVLDREGLERWLK